MASAREQRGLSTVVRVMTIVLAASCPLSGGGPAGRGVASNETDPRDQCTPSDLSSITIRYIDDLNVRTYLLIKATSSDVASRQHVPRTRTRRAPSDTIRYATCPQDHNQANCPARAVTHL
jgi:hypothetical protein